MQSEKIAHFDYLGASYSTDWKITLKKKQVHGWAFWKFSLILQFWKKNGISYSSNLCKYKSSLIHITSVWLTCSTAKLMLHYHILHYICVNVISIWFVCTLE